MTKSDWHRETRDLILPSILVILLAQVILAMAPSVEGVLAPVTSRATLIKGTPFDGPPPPSTQFTAAAIKYRDCSFVGIEWKLGDRLGHHVPVGAHFTDKPQLRGEGRLEWSGLVVGLDERRARENSFATVIHRCPLFKIGSDYVFRPWKTRTAFY